MDIVYGPCPSQGGSKYMLLLVDQCTTYTWAYGMSGRVRRVDECAVRADEIHITAKIALP